MSTASSLVTFWHIATVMPPEIVYDLKAAGRNESYTGGHIGDATMLVMEGDSLWLRCRSDQNATWLIQSEGPPERWITMPILGLGDPNVLMFGPVHYANDGKYACAIKTQEAKFFSKLPGLSTTITLKVQKYEDLEKNFDGSYQILRHTPTKQSVPSEGTANLCVDFSLPTSIPLTGYHDVAATFAQKFWRLPHQSPTIQQRSFLRPPSPAYNRQNMVDMTSCVHIQSATANSEGKYTGDLSDFNREVDQGHAMSFTVELTPTFNASMSLSTGRGQPENVRLMAGSTYQLSCETRGSPADGTIHTTRVDIEENEQPVYRHMSWCSALPKTPGLARLGDTETIVSIAATSKDNITVPSPGKLKCIRTTKVLYEGRREAPVNEEEVGTLNYTIVDDPRLANEQTDILIESEIGDGYIMTPSGRPIALPQGARMILKCVVPRCAFGEIKWIRTENHEVYALVSSQNDYPSLDNEKRSQKNLSNTNETNANSTEEFTSRFYANTPMTIVLELIFPSVRYSQAADAFSGTYACLASSDGLKWKSSTVKVPLRVRAPPKNRQQSPASLHVVAIPPLEVPGTTTTRSSGTHYDQEPSVRHVGGTAQCSEHMKHIVVGVTVAAIVSLVLVAICSLALCYRLNKANLLKNSSMVIRGPTAKRQRASVKMRLIQSNAPSLATEEEMSI